MNPTTDAERITTLATAFSLAYNVSAFAKEKYQRLSKETNDAWDASVEADKQLSGARVRLLSAALDFANIPEVEGNAL